MRGFERLQQVAFPQLTRTEGELEYARVSGRGAWRDTGAARGRGRFVRTPRPSGRQRRRSRTRRTSANCQAVAGDCRRWPREVGRPGWGDDAQARMNAAARPPRPTRRGRPAPLRVRRGGQAHLRLARGAVAVRAGAGRAASPGTGLLARLGPGEPVTGFAFAEKLTPLGTMRAGSHAGPPGPPGIGGEAADASAAGGARGGWGPAQRKGTDVAAAVAAALARSRRAAGRAGSGALLRRAADRPGERPGDDAGRGGRAGVRGRGGPGGARGDLSFGEISVARSGERRRSWVRRSPSARSSGLHGG